MGYGQQSGVDKESERVPISSMHQGGSRCSDLFRARTYAVLKPAKISLSNQKILYLCVLQDICIFRFFVLQGDMKFGDNNKKIYRVYTQYIYRMSLNMREKFRGLIP